MKTLIPHAFKTSRQGMALVMVISALALMTILMVAIFTTTQNEYKSTQAYVNARSARDLADTATAIVEAQIQNGHYIGAGAARTFHVTQPGMVRVYNTDGSFNTAYKLYSSTTMQVTGNSETDALSGEPPPADWRTNVNNQARYVDLNEPVVRPSLSAAPGADSQGVDVFFPIIDPRAAWNYAGNPNPGPNDPTTQVEGFSYTNTPSTNSAITYSEVLKVADAKKANELRLPMPVEWIYVLQNGAMGTLDAALNWKPSPTATTADQPTADNPIVGRVAFWTDDECCKVNINTASEPTYWQSPFYYHKRDYMWANCPPVVGEYQRYPGHPATVALSAILAPNTHLDPLAPSLDPSLNSSLNTIMALKNYIYGVAPKIAAGGSQSGTLPFDSDSLSKPFNEIGANGQSVAQFIDINMVKSERLYASVDELLFQDSAFNGSETGTAQAAGTGRLPNFTNQFGKINLFSHDVLEHARFFLTAQSRAPEFTMYGLPRVAIWPLPDESLPTKCRTSFDQAIALSSTLRGSKDGIDNSYIFRRYEAHDQSYDLSSAKKGLQRNQYLLNYLVTQMQNLTWPQTSSLGSAKNFKDKYGPDNVNQLAVQFFDYIRCTNLYDSILARQNDASAAYSILHNIQNPPSPKNLLPLDYGPLYIWRDQNAKKPGTHFYTFTNPRITTSNSTSFSNSSASYDSTTGQYNSADGNVVPGHGTVTPILWQNGSKKYQGFGRFVTISEVGFNCLCTADGYPDPNGVLFPPGDPKTTPNQKISGGVTARRTSTGPNPTATNGAIWPSTHPLSNTLLKDALARWYSNFPPLDTTNTANFDHTVPNGIAYNYGINATNPAKDPKTGKLNLAHPYYHPGYYPQFWNYTLKRDTPLMPNQKRIQLVLMLEMFCPMQGWTKMYPEFTIKIDPQSLQNLMISGNNTPSTQLFTGQTNNIIKSNANIFQYGSGAANTWPSGGHAGPGAITGNGIARPLLNQNNGIFLPADSGWTADTSTLHSGLTQYSMNSDFVTVDRNDQLQISCSGGLKFYIYDTHDYLNKEPVQTIIVQLPSKPFTAPHLAMNDCPAANGNLVDNVGFTQIAYHYSTDAYGRNVWTRALQPPHWWCFNQKGCVNIMDPNSCSINQNAFNKGLAFSGPPAEYPYGYVSADRQSTNGRLDTTPTGAGINPGGVGYWTTPPIIPNEILTNYPGSDVLRTVIPAAGDYRLVAALNQVPEGMWEPHPAWTGASNDPMLLHSFSDNIAGGTAGCILPPNVPKTLSGNPYDLQLVARVPLGNPTNANLSDYSQTPDMPPSVAAGKDANRYGDFDNGPPGTRLGPYLNKPDEGNFYSGNVTLGSSNQVKYRAGYFWDPWNDTDDAKGIYMSPNRMISSAVMFGSLPTAVWGGGPGAAQQSKITGQPWQTLLFRPYSQSNIGSGGVSVADGHPGDYNPRDHFLLDMFSMPVVEPYAISEPLSMAGRINLNYQIMPFTNIRRATALHALMKGEFITAVPNEQAYWAKNSKPNTNSASPVLYNDDSNDQQHWHRPINVKETLKQFDEKFDGTASGSNHNIVQVQGLFRSASQICEIHLIPDVSQGASPKESGLYVTNLTSSTRQKNMDTFWQNHAVTGDNVRERPYSNLYNRITTRSNTFRVHVRAQTIKKARSTSPTVFDQTKDAILSEYRGSTLIERYIEPNAKKNALDSNDTTTSSTNVIPDYAAKGNPLGEVPLESFYRFRTLETKRFNP